MSIAERALAAAAAKQESDRLANEAKLLAEKTQAIQLIQQAGERLGIDITADEIVPRPTASGYGYSADLDDGVCLLIEAGSYIKRFESARIRVEAEPRPWATYSGDVGTLADIGAKLKDIARSRAMAKERAT